MWQVIRAPRRMVRVARRLEQAGKRIGVVPTMGALHEGHGALIRAAARANDVVIVTIFVNPLQFGPREDVARYPRVLSRDQRLAKAAGAHFLFVPSVAQLYPRGFETTVTPGPLAARWEGAVRPGHFRGVATVVMILCELTRPTRVYFGQKDYQQALIVKRLIRDFRLPIRFCLVPTVREADGLAMSSRNAYLKPEERARAGVLYRALSAGAARIRNGVRRVDDVLQTVRAMIRRTPGARLDYAAAVDAETLEPLARIGPGRVALLLAVRLGRTRLIDNLLVAVP